MLTSISVYLIYFVSQFPVFLPNGVVIRYALSGMTVVLTLSILVSTIGQHYHIPNTLLYYFYTGIFILSLFDFYFFLLVVTPGVLPTYLIWSLLDLELDNADTPDIRSRMRHNKFYLIVFLTYSLLLFLGYLAFISLGYSFAHIVQVYGLVHTDIFGPALALRYDLITFISLAFLQSIFLTTALVFILLFKNFTYMDYPDTLYFMSIKSVKLYHTEIAVYVSIFLMVCSRSLYGVLKLIDLFYPGEELYDYQINLWFSNIVIGFIIAGMCLYPIYYLKHRLNFHKFINERV